MDGWMLCCCFKYKWSYIFQQRTPVEAVEGSNVVLICRMPSITSPDLVRWYKGEGSQRTHIFSHLPKAGDRNDARVSWTGKNPGIEFSIVIEDVKISDTGKYYCIKYADEKGDTISDEGPGVTLTVTGSAIFQQKSPVEAVQGSKAILICRMPSITSLDLVRWYKGEGSQRTHIFSRLPKAGDRNDARVTWTRKNHGIEFSIVIDGVKISDTGKYYCIKYADEKGDTISEEGPGVTLTVTGSTIFQQKTPVEAVQGSKAILICRMSLVTSPDLVRWYKGEGRQRTHIFSRLPKAGDRNDARVSWTRKNHGIEFSIVIDGVKISDTGKYYCIKYADEKGDTISEEGPGVTLTVTGEHSQSPVEAVEASGQILVCVHPKETSEGHVKCYSSQQIHIRTSDDQGNEKDISQIAWTEKNLSSNITLTMRDVRGSDLDEYCEKYKKMSNGKPRGSDGLLQMTDVNQPQSSVEAVEGGDVTLTCILSSELPLGPIKWYKEVGSERTHFYSAVPHRDEKNDPRVAWTMDKVTVDYSITIRNIRFSDMGEYYCVKYRKGEEDKPYASGPGVTLTVRGA
ncbi:uncharacterized protein LOC120538050 isoform X2 [Polypterus senegalus]|uniref:uncharacterized protein LOC120538050 isoform X2 n=1 Tax=Polypterus senegalus TaxID=55291 RepID=UPI0019634DDC|nr:uncharacterized protein LOC120538050 isoform X2 [Polypterus senegalus]